jgi:predicted outer membrane repeat protein
MSSAVMHQFVSDDTLHLQPYDALHGVATVSFFIIQHGSLSGLDRHGGGIDNLGTLSLNVSQVSNNSATGLFSSGGGIASEPGGFLTLRASRVANNNTNEFGGGIYAKDGTVNLQASLVSGNTGSQGGGIFIDRAGIFNLQASLVSGNTANNSGGGIFAAALGTANLRVSPVFDNTAANMGGGIFDAGTVNLTASPVLVNHPDNCAPPNSVPGCFG